MFRLLLLFISGVFFSNSFLLAQSQQSDKIIKSSYSSDTALLNSYLFYGKTLETSHPDSAAFYYKKSETLALQLKDKHLLRTCMGRHIHVLNYEAKFEEALVLAQQHLTIAKQLNDSPILLQACNEVANEFEYLGDYQQATEYYLKALQLASGRGNKKIQTALNNNLASVFLALKDYPTAYTYSTHAFQMSEEDKDTITMGNCLINMGVAELNQKEYLKALHHFDIAEKIGYHISDMTLVADALSDKGLAYLTMHNLKAAESSYQKQKAIANQYHLPYQKFYSLFQLALVAKEKGNFKEADRYASRAIAIGERLGTRDELIEMYDSMAVIKQKTGDLQAALNYKNKYEAINNSLRNEEIQTNIHHLNIQYRSAQKDKQIAEQNLSIERNKAAIEKENIWIFTFLSGIIALGIILLLSLRSYHHKQKLHQQSLLTLQKEHEVSTLKAKMQAREEERDRIGREMHDDIGSALTTILYLSDDLKTQNRETAIRAAGKIAENASSVVDKMNEIIWSMNSEYDSLDDLISYTRQNAAQFLEDHCLKYHLDIPETITSIHLLGEQRRNIYLTIKEALHNIVKHAFATEVTISFCLNDNLHIIIHDNGKGFNKVSHFGNGLKNIRQRMESIGGSFEIISEAGTTVKLICPLHMSTSAEQTGI